MLVFSEIEATREQIVRWKSQTLSVAFVPTMGNLHAGHLALVEKAKTVADNVVVSIYVNPLQFGANEDFSSYPRTLETDQAALFKHGADLLFLPDNATMYANSPGDSTQVQVSGISDILCGEFRRGHFVGVAAVVCKLFHIVQPDIVIFGEKDFQQVAVIRKMVADLFLPVQIMTLPTVRESDGLAMSSRNQYLSSEQRQQAALLYRTMQTLVAEAQATKNFRQVEKQGMVKLEQHGFEPEYVRFCDPNTLVPADAETHGVVLLVAAWLGKTRLIDNLPLSIDQWS